MTFPSPDYITLAQAGPFPDQVDPWAENPRYFQQLHSGMLHHFLGQFGYKARKYIVPRNPDVGNGLGGHWVAPP